MQRFFPDFEAVDRYTLSLRSLDGYLQCPHCKQGYHLISHGVIYRQRSIDQREPVGKRVFCSNREPHTGCGRTVQLFVATVVPTLRYAATTVFAFLSALWAQASVANAWRRATGHSVARQAWRWLGKLERRLAEFRSRLTARPVPADTPLTTRCRRLRLLLPTLEHVFTPLPEPPGAHYQLVYQSPLL